ncbi:MAG: Smr/MutS family protein [Steroidobacteraceae bacterium]
MRTPVEEADAALFREATRDVRPLGEKRLPPPRAKPPPPRARFTRADRLAVLEESLHGDPLEDGTDGVSGGESTSFARPAVQASVLRKLRRGHFRIQAEVDLHGLTVQEAKGALREFLAEALERGLSCVRIIHGKGLRSGPRGPVLRIAVSGVLQRTGRVLAFVSARAVDGGTGAVYVLLSSRPR